jgi:hypothetical protein
MSVIADMGLLSKLRRLKAIESDPRANKQEQISARRLFDRRCRQANVDPKDIRLDGYSFNGRTVVEYQTAMRTLDAKVHAICILIGTFWKVEIRALEGKDGLRFDFIARDPKDAPNALDAFKFMVEAAEIHWEGLLKRHEQDSRPTAPRGSIAEMFAHRGVGAWGLPKPQKKSFISGFFHTLNEELSEGKASAGDIQAPG